MKLAFLLLAFLVVQNGDCRMRYRAIPTDNGGYMFVKQDDNLNDVEELTTRSFAVGEWSSTAKPESLDETPDEQREDRRIFSQEFLEHYAKFIKQCLSSGCTICEENPSITSEEKCKRVQSIGRPNRSFLIPLTKLTVKQHGFMEIRLQFKMFGEENKTFKVRLMEIAEMVKKVMVAKEKIESCAPQLQQYEPAINETIFSLPLISQAFLESLSPFVDQVVQSGGNFCLGKATDRGENCFRIDWQPVCHNFSNELPTMTVQRMANEVVITMSSRTTDSVPVGVPDWMVMLEAIPSAETAERSFRLETTTLSQFRQGFNSARRLTSGMADPVTTEQVFQLGNSLMDWLAEHAFRRPSVTQG